MGMICPPKPKANALNLNRLGGSDMAAILGISRYSTPLDVWARIVHGAQKQDTPQMEWGRRLERVIADAWAEKTGREIRPGESVESAVRAWQRYTVDFYVLHYPEILEIKTAGWRQREEYGEEGTDQIQDEYVIQTNTYLEATGLERARVVVLFEGHDLREYVVPRDRELGGIIVQEAEKFWRDYIVTQKMPPIDGSESAKRAIDARYPENKRPKRDADSIENKLALELKEIELRLKQIEGEKDRVENALRYSIGEANGIKGEWGSMAWTRIAPMMGPDYEAMAQALCPDPAEFAKLAEKHQIVRRHGYRRFSKRWAKQ